MKKFIDFLTDQPKSALLKKNYYDFEQKKLHIFSTKVSFFLFFFEYLKKKKNCLPTYPFLRLLVEKHQN
jgi:hypothetical protein